VTKHFWGSIEPIKYPISNGRVPSAKYNPNTTQTTAHIKYRVAVFRKYMVHRGHDGIERGFISSLPMIESLLVGI
jgi:hypothetical protein